MPTIISKIPWRSPIYKDDLMSYLNFQAIAQIKTIEKKPDLYKTSLVFLAARNKPGFWSGAWVNPVFNYYIVSENRDKITNLTDQTVLS
ncbi:MAG: hypothetical protein WBA93_32955 [Microcoleaceae cyanobacterium]